MLGKKFFYLAPALLLLTGCAVPMGGYGYGGYGSGYGSGYGGYGSGFGGYGDYGGYACGSPYGYSCPAPQAGYPMVPYWYAYCNAYAYPANPPAVNGPATATEDPPGKQSGQRNQQPPRQAQNRGGHNQKNSPTEPGVTEPGATPPGATPPGDAPNANPNNNTLYGQHPGQQPGSNQQSNRQAAQLNQRPNAQAPQQQGNYRGLPAGSGPQRATQQARPGTSMAAPAGPRVMARTPAPNMAAPNPGANRAVRAPQPAPQAQGAVRMPGNRSR